MNIYQLTRNARRAGKGKAKHACKMFHYAQQLSKLHAKPVRSSIPKKKQRQYGLVDNNYGGSPGPALLQDCQECKSLNRPHCIH